MNIHTNGDVFAGEQYLGCIDSDAEWRPDEDCPHTEEEIQAALLALYMSDDGSWDELDWPADARRFMGVGHKTTLGEMADVYGVILDERGFDGPADEDAVILLWKDRAGAWHVKAPAGYEGMTDEEWAPCDDSQAQHFAT